MRWGDVAYVKQDGKPLLGIAPEALQQGTAVAGNLKRQFRGLTPKPFNYLNKRNSSHNCSQRRSCLSVWQNSLKRLACLAVVVRYFIYITFLVYLNVW